MLGFERKDERLAPFHLYLGRIALGLLVSAGIVACSLAAGMVGYHYFEGMSWLDSFLNAAMILSGMGPVGTLATDAGKLFAGCYAIYSGFVVVLTTGIVLAPIAHRLLHRFHIDDD